MPTLLVMKNPWRKEKIVSAVSSTFEESSAQPIVGPGILFPGFPFPLVQPQTSSKCSSVFRSQRLDHCLSEESLSTVPKDSQGGAGDEL